MGGFIIDNSGSIKYRTRPYGLTPALRQHPLCGAVWRPAPCRLLNIRIFHYEPPRMGGFTIDNSGSIKYRTRPYGLTPALRQHPLSDEVVMVGFG